MTDEAMSPLRRRMIKLGCLMGRAHLNGFDTPCSG